VQLPGALYHVTARGNNRERIFAEDWDRVLFLDCLDRVDERYAWMCHAYCLMDTHYHLLIETPQPNLALGCQRLNGVYAQLFNQRHGRIGHLFQGRYHAALVQTDSHVLEAARYIVLNPVRAGLARGPADWSWTSYHATAGLALRPRCLVTEWILGQIAPNVGRARTRYRRFVSEGVRTGSIFEPTARISFAG
jgi:putative transposase